MKLTLLTIVLSVVSATAGIFVEKHLHGGRCNCPEDLTASLQGCEMVATTVNEMLSECSWEKSNCQHRLVEQMDRNNKTLKLFMPDHIERK